MQLYYHFTTRLPIIEPSAVLQKELEDYADWALTTSGADNPARLNDLVAEAYSLTTTERQVMALWFERRSLSASEGGQDEDDE